MKPVFISESYVLNYVTIDIECVPLKINDQDIWVYLSEKATVRTMHPVFSKVITIGLKEFDQDPEVLYSDDEKQLLDDFWSKLAAIEPDKVITFNGYGFDIPFLDVRSLMNNIQPTKNINTNKWNMERSNHYDCMLALSSKGNFLNVAQDIVCKIMSIPVEEKIEGSRIEKCYISGDWDSINNKCRQDVIQTEQIFKKLHGM